MALRRSLAAVCLLIAVGACGGSETITVEDVSPSFRDVQHRLGIIERAMDRAPNPPASSLNVPKRLQGRLARDGLFDPEVRAWADRRLRATEKLDEQRWSIFLPLIGSELEPMRDRLSDVRAEGPISTDFARLTKDYGRGAFEWVTAESQATAESVDAGLIIRRAVRAHDRFLEEARAGAFPTDHDAEAAYLIRVAPTLRDIRDAQTRSLTIRSNVEDAVGTLNEHRLALSRYLEDNEDARNIAALIAEDDPRGLFGYFAEKGAQ